MLNKAALDMRDTKPSPAKDVAIVWYQPLAANKRSSCYNIIWMWCGIKCVQDISMKLPKITGFLTLFILQSTLLAIVKALTMSKSCHSTVPPLFHVCMCPLVLKVYDLPVCYKGPIIALLSHYCFSIKKITTTYRQTLRQLLLNGRAAEDV